jgi:DNA-binding MarR family transcriptional regulator
MTENAPTPPPGLTELATYLASKTGLAGRRIMGEHLDELDMRPAHFAVLACLDAYGAGSQRQLAERLALDASDVVAILDEMEDRRLIERRRDPQDRRRYAVTPTRTGRAAYARARKAARAAQDEFLEGLDAEERVVFEATLARVLARHDARFTGLGPGGSTPGREATDARPKGTE